MSSLEEMPDEELAEFSVLETFDKDRLKVLFEEFIVFWEGAVEIVWKMENLFNTENFV